MSALPIVPSPPVSNAVEPQKVSFTKRLQVLGDIKQVILTSVNLEDTLGCVLQLLQTMVPFAQADIAEYDYETQEIYIIASTDNEPLPLAYDNRLPLSFSNHPTSSNWQEIKYIPDLARKANLSPVQSFLLTKGIRSVAVVALFVRETLLGSLSIGAEKPNAFSKAQLSIVQDVAYLISLRLQQAAVEKQHQNHTLNLEALVELRTAELQEMINKLAEANKLKNEFMAAISHELYTPLNAILGKVENMHEEVYGPLNSDQQRASKVIIEHGYKLLRLINNLLDVSHLEAEQLSLYLKEVDVISVCLEMVSAARHAAHSKKVKVVANLPTHPVFITADEDRFRQILFNLLENAVKFTPTGGTVGLDVVEDEAEECVHFMVWDTGIGISPDKIDFIFMLFTQIDGRLTREYEGTGLGLPLAYRLTQLHDGQMSVTSDIGKGSRFTVTLPIAFATIKTAV